MKSQYPILSTTLRAISAVLILVGLLVSGCKDKDHEHLVDVERKKAISQKLYEMHRNEDSLLRYLNKSIHNNDKVGQMLAYKQYGKFLRENSRFSEAISNHQEGLKQAIALRDTLEIVQAFNNLGTDFRRIGALSEASEYHYNALEYSEAYSDKESHIARKNKVMAINGLGNINLSLESYDEASRLFKDALVEEKKLNSHLGMAINYANLGSIFEEKNQLDSAWIYYQNSMEQNRLADSNLGVGLCYIHFGQLLEKEGKYEEAKGEFKNAYNLMKDISDKWHWLKACTSIARINLIIGNYDEFKKYVDRAEKTANDINSPRYLAEVYELKHEYYLKQGNHQLALDNFKHSKLLQDSLSGIQKANRYMDLRINYERNKSAREIANITREVEEKERSKKLISGLLIASLFIAIIIASIIYYAYRQRTRSNRMLKQLEKTRTNFYTNITHEFRTPLTIIMGLNEQMQENPSLSPKEMEIFHETIDNQCSKLLNLVNQLLDITKLKSGSLRLEWKHGDIIAYLRMTAEAYKIYAKKNSVDLQFFSAFSSFDMDFVPFHMDKIVSNLLSNAIKHSEAGDKVTLIAIPDEEHEEITIKVTDTGEGIAEDELKLIFDVFYQSPNSRNPKGTGVGLAFTKLLVEKMGGKIFVESQKDVGSTFSIKLPTRNKAYPNLPFWNAKGDFIPGEAAKTEDTISPLETSSTVPTDETKDLPIVLVVEDNKDISLYISTLLRDKYNVLTAWNGEEGYQVAKDSLPDIIITDIMMPKKDGYWLCNQIKSSTLLNHIPVVVLTAKGSEENKIESFKYGVEAFLRKPFHSEELLLRISNILEKRKLLKEKYMRAIIKDEKNDKKQHVNDDNMDFLHTVTDIIYSEISNPDLNANLVAEKVAMSPSQLNRKLNMLTGYSLISYILQIKIKKAMKLLANPQISIGEVAQAYGFNDTSYFSRTFKKFTGFTPTKYQKMPTQPDETL